MRSLIIPTVLLALFCTACGGGDSPENPGGGTHQTIHASIAIPIPNEGSVSLVSAAPASINCPSIPDGYLPMANAEVEFLDQEGDVVDQIRTDACGHFQRTVSAEVRRVRIHRTGYQTLQLESESLATSVESVISTISTTARYVISVMQLIGPRQLAFAISDDQTGKAVLGLSEQNFQVRIAGITTEVNHIVYGAAEAEAASIALVMDASGSMSDNLGDYDSRTKMDVAYQAAHVFLDGLQHGHDEIGTVVFSIEVDLMNTEHFNELLHPFNRQTRQPDSYEISDSGLTRDIDKQRLVIEAYQGGSVYTYQYDMDQLPDPWEWAGTPPHPNGAQHLLLDSYYPWGSGTALYDALLAGINMLDQSATHRRRIVVALSDGMDTFSTHTLAQTLAYTKSNAIPLYIVGLGQEADMDVPGMMQLTNQSGGYYRHSTGGDLSGLFQGIQTGIRFQYLATLGATPVSGELLELTLLTNNSRTSRSIRVR